MTSTDSSGRYSRQRLGVGQGARDVQEKASRHHDLPVAVDIGFERRAQRDLHVGCGQVEAAVFGAKLNPAEHEHGSARRDPACDDTQLVGEEDRVKRRLSTHLRAWFLSQS